MQIVSPFPPSKYRRLWDWLGQFPLNHFDDGGPRTCDEFAGTIAERLAHGERLYGVFDDRGELVGAIGMAFLSPRAAMFHGISFDRPAHGTGIAQRAVAAILDELFRSGIEKVSAAYFADNERVHRFLKKLGAVEEGYLRRQTRRGGVPVDMRLVAFFKEEGF
jgi:RimJ/RimL family protein N-acetyltransferase